MKRREDNFSKILFSLSQQRVRAADLAPSRREADAWVEAGRVAINGVPATLGSKVEAHDHVTVDGKPVGARKPGRGCLARSPSRWPSHWPLRSRARHWSW